MTPDNAGGMECDCWDARPWYVKLYDRIVGYFR